MCERLLEESVADFLVSVVTTYKLKTVEDEPEDEHQREDPMMALEERS